MNGDEAAPGPRCPVTGATGCIGGRLVPELLAAGYRVRALARSPGKLRDHPWSGAVEVAGGGFTRSASVAQAMHGVDVAYHPVHALGTGRGFERPAARSTRRRTAADRRLIGLLAGRGDRAGTSAAAAGRKAAAGPRLAGDVSRQGRRRTHPVPPARPVPSAHAARPRLPVERLPLPRPRVRRIGPQHREGRDQGPAHCEGGTRTRSLTRASARPAPAGSTSRPLPRVPESAP